jgi:hypothetical protein
VAGIPGSAVQKIVPGTPAEDVVAGFAREHVIAPESKFRAQRSAALAQLGVADSEPSGREISQ